MQVATPKRITFAISDDDREKLRRFMVATNTDAHLWLSEQIAALPEYKLVIVSGEHTSDSVKKLQPSHEDERHARITAQAKAAKAKPHESTLPGVRVIKTADALDEITPAPPVRYSGDSGKGVDDDFSDDAGQGDFDDESSQGGFGGRKR